MNIRGLWSSLNTTGRSSAPTERPQYPGLLAGVQISQPSSDEKGCPVVEVRVADRIYLLNCVPRLPRPGCKRVPCCACIFVR
jgi:hypothetical protein